MTDVFLRVGEPSPSDVRLRDPTVPDGGGGTTLSPSDGAISLAGQVCSITLALAVAVGALTLDANTPALAFSYAPTHGAVTVSGETPVIVRSYVPAAGDATLTGNAPALTGILAPSDGSVEIGGNAPAVAAILSPADGSISVAGDAPSIVLIVADTVSATPGFNIRGLAAAFRGHQPDEEEKRQRRASYFPTDKLATATASSAAQVYSEKSAKVAAAIARFNAESRELRAQIAKLEADQAAQENAKLEHELTLKRQALLLAEVQRAVLLEEMEVLDVAYFALIVALL